MSTQYSDKMDEIDLKVLWDKFSMGDAINDQELEWLIVSAQEGVRYLRSRRENLAASRTNMDLEMLLSYQRARKRQW